MIDTECPDCGAKLEWLAGEPAHPANRYCPKCGYEAWNKESRTKGATKMSHDYEKDLEIIEAASLGHWEDCQDASGDKYISGAGHEYIAEIGCPDFKGADDARYIAHFNPSYAGQLVEKAMERDALRAELITRVGELQVMSEEEAELRKRCLAAESGGGVEMKTYKVLSAPEQAELQDKCELLKKQLDESYDLIYEAIEYVAESGRYGASDLAKRMREILP